MNIATPANNMKWYARNTKWNRKLFAFAMKARDWWKRKCTPNVNRLGKPQHQQRKLNNKMSASTLPTICPLRTYEMNASSRFRSKIKMKRRRNIYDPVSILKMLLQCATMSEELAFFLSLTASIIERKRWKISIKIMIIIKSCILLCEALEARKRFFFSWVRFASHLKRKCNNFS